MTRLTLGELKAAAKDPKLRRSLSQSGDKGRPTPFSAAASAVRNYHRIGPNEARTRLRESFESSNYWGPQGNATAKGWARQIRESFDAYVNLALADQRPCLYESIVRDVNISDYVVGVRVDVVLLDDDGYVARHVLWDSQRPEKGTADVLVVPIIKAVQESLGEDRAAGVEVWHLRTGTQWFYTVSEAIANAQTAKAVIASYLS